LKDLPNFAAWNTDTLVKFAEESYVRMQQQQDAIQSFQRDLRDAMIEIRRLVTGEAK